MNKSIYKYSFPLIIFLFSLIFISASFFLEQQKEREQNQKILQNQLIQKNIQETLDKKNYLVGEFDPDQKENFILIPDQYIIVKNKMYLRKETYIAFLKMEEAAKKDGVNLKITSATRNFNAQKNIWGNKWAGIADLNGLEKFKKILEYSAAPGTSRHHWGTK